MVATIVKKQLSLNCTQQHGQPHDVKKIQSGKMQEIQKRK